MTAKKTKEQEAALAATDDLLELIGASGSADLEQRMRDLLATDHVSMFNDLPATDHNGSHAANDLADPEELEDFDALEQELDTLNEVMDVVEGRVDGLQDRIRAMIEEAEQDRLLQSAAAASATKKNREDD